MNLIRFLALLGCLSTLPVSHAADLHVTPHLVPWKFASARYAVAVM